MATMATNAVPEPTDRPTVLVTGATGTVGRHVVTGLLARGAAVRAAVRDPAATTLPTGVTPVRFAFGEPATYPEAFEGVTSVFLVRPPQIARVRRSVLPALDEARRAGVGRVAFLSLQGADRNPVVPHRRIEDDLVRNGPAWTMLRPGFFFQNLLSPHGPDIAERDEIYLPAGRGRTAFVDARDVAEAGVRVLVEPGHEGKGYELTGGAPLRYDEVAEALSTALGRDVRYVDASPWGFWRRMRSRGLPHAQIAVMLALYTTCRLGLAGNVSGELESLLRRPPHSIATFARDHRDAWMPAPAATVRRAHRAGEGEPRAAKPSDDGR